MKTEDPISLRLLVCPKCHCVATGRPTGGEKRYGCGCIDDVGAPPRLKLEDWIQRCAALTPCKDCKTLPYERHLTVEKNTISHLCEGGTQEEVDWWQGTPLEWLNHAHGVDPPASALDKVLDGSFEQLKQQVAVLEQRLEEQQTSSTSNEELNYLRQFKVRTLELTQRCAIEVYDVLVEEFGE